MNLRDQPVTQLPGSDILYINYNTLKTILNTTTYENISDYTLNLISTIVASHPLFEIHMDLNGFTASSCASQGDILKKFCNKIVGAGTQYTSKLKYMYIYNTPRIMNLVERIVAPYADSNHADKYVYYNRNESKPKLIDLFNKY